MQEKNENKEQTYLEEEIDKIILKLIIPITDELKAKAKEIKQKRIELKKEIYDMRQLKLAIIEKRKKLNKQKKKYENHMNSDFSNVKTCEECLVNYINLMDKKEKDFIKEKDDFYELKLRKKEIEFNNNLIDLIKEKINIEKRKKIRRKMSFEAPRRPLNKSNQSIEKNMNKSFRSVENNKKSVSQNKSKMETPKKDYKSKKIKNKNSMNKDKNKNKYGYKEKDIRNIKRKNSNESNDINNNNVEENKENKEQDISREIENLINNYSSKKSGVKASYSINSENYNDGLEQLKEINKDTKSIENDLKEMMDNL